MRERRGIPGIWLSGLFGFAWPWYCYADYGGSWFHFSTGEQLGIIGVLALPTAATCVLTEAIHPRRRVAMWLSGVCAFAAMLGTLLAMKAGAGSSLVFLWFLVPPLATLALRGALPHPLHRFVAGWIVAGVVLASGIIKHHGPDDWLILVGGAIPCLLLWSVVVLIFAARGIKPEAARSMRSELRASATAAAVRTTVQPFLGGVERALAPAQTGLYWWLGASAFWYFGIGIAIAAGKLSGGLWIYSELQQLFDVFAVPLPKMVEPRQLWWFVGLPWSLIAGSAIWGLAGTFGAFDPGRARIARFAGIVFGGALLIWSASILMQVSQVEAAEERAAGIHR
jgi:hypothetical protein